MKKIYIGLAVLFFGALWAAIIYGGISLFKSGVSFDQESREYVDSVVVSMTSDWDPQVLIDNAAPALLEVSPPEKIEILFKAFSEKLGPLRDYQGAKGQAKVFVSPREGKSVTGDYVANIIFEKAPGNIQIRTVQLEGQWKVLQFNVASEGLLK